ncbi:MAG: mandelate racemase/muconate lactonizing enzyme family protein [Pseudolabrys sp.]|nr:mandelate racemase/muconate lactonizing enzyme family protein [Pseudolabrys sp.]
MIIEKVIPHQIRIPFDAGPANAARFGKGTSALDTVLVEVVTDTGLTGWGDAFAYACSDAVVAAISQMVASRVVGLPVPQLDEIQGFSDRLQRQLHLFGRYGITMFAISGLDIALWDLAGKIAGKTLSDLIGPRRRAAIPAYASLLSIGEPGAVASESKKAVAKGFRAIKIHETTVEAVAAARDAIGPDVPLMVDMNCPMSAAEAIAFATSCRPYAPLFLEEPVWPPEDFRSQARVQMNGRVAVAAGENACTAWQFNEMISHRAVTWAQPSITKVGGVTEFGRVAALADRSNVRLMPHSPYFGPGLIATLQMLSLREDASLVEWYYMDRAACLWGDALALDIDGAIAVPTGPGLGLEPDRDVIARYAVR